MKSPQIIDISDLFPPEEQAAVREQLTRAKTSSKPPARNKPRTRVIADAARAAIKRPPRKQTDAMRAHWTIATCRCSRTYLYPNPLYSPTSAVFETASFWRGKKLLYREEQESHALYPPSASVEYSTATLTCCPSCLAPPVGGGDHPRQLPLHFCEPWEHGDFLNHDDLRAITTLRITRALRANDNQFPHIGA